VSEPFSWMDEGQGTEGGWRMDGGKKEGREGGKAPQLSGAAACCFSGHTHAHVNTHHQAHSARLTDACRTMGRTPNSVLTLAGHTQGLHYTGYTWG
jgi:hypothetical protein